MRFFFLFSFILSPRRAVSVATSYRHFMTGMYLFVHASAGLPVGWIKAAHVQHNLHRNLVKLINGDKIYSNNEDDGAV